MQLGASIKYVRVRTEGVPKSADFEDENYCENEDRGVQNPENFVDVLPLPEPP